MNFIDSMDKDNDGWTPLIFACRYGHQDAVQLFETFLVILNHCDSVQCKSCFEEKEKCTELQVYDNASKQKWCCMHVWLVLCSTCYIQELFSHSWGDFSDALSAEKNKWCVYNQGKMNSSLNNALKSNCAL